MFNDKYKTYLPAIFHKIDTWNSDIDQVNDYWEIKRPTDVVIAPGSDMPYCLCHYVESTPGVTDGWPPQAASPAAYASLLNSEQDTHAYDWQPILLSHKPVRLLPGFYVPALPIIQYWGDQWGRYHDWPYDNDGGMKEPEVLLMESSDEVEINPYMFTTYEHPAGPTNNYYSPWLLVPNRASRVGTDASALPFSKVLGFGRSNQTGSNQIATCSMNIYLKDLTRPDAVGVINYIDFASTNQMVDGVRVNTNLESFSWFMFRLRLNSVTSYTPEGCAYIFF